MTTVRIIGDVHGGIHRDDLVTGQPQSYLEIIADAPYSIQVGDMGDGQSYAQLTEAVDPGRHRFFPGNHDHYNCLPQHCLGHFGALSWGGVDLFFIRGAASSDRAKLVSLGQRLGKTLWYEQEELTEEQMRAAEEEYLRLKPSIVLSHDAPTDIARLIWKFAMQFGPPKPGEVFEPSRTNALLARLLEKHQPRLWAFGHYHRNWRYQDGETTFVCVGELSYIDIKSTGDLCGPV